MNYTVKHYYVKSTIMDIVDLIWISHWYTST